MARFIDYVEIKDGVTIAKEDIARGGYSYDAKEDKAGMLAATLEHKFVTPALDGKEAGSLLRQAIIDYESDAATKSNISILSWDDEIVECDIVFPCLVAKGEKITRHRSMYPWRPFLGNSFNSDMMIRWSEFALEQVRLRIAKYIVPSNMGYAIERWMPFIFTIYIRFGCPSRKPKLSRIGKQLDQILHIEEDRLAGIELAGIEKNMARLGM